MNKLQVLRIASGILFIAMIFTTNITFAGNGNNGNNGNQNHPVCDNGTTVNLLSQNEVKQYLQTHPGSTEGECVAVPNVVPVITLTGGNLSLVVGDVYSEPGYSASDSEDGNITGDVVVGGDNINTSLPGVYIVTYNVTDSDGASAIQKTREITVSCDDGYTQVENECVINQDPDETAPDMPVHVSPADGVTLTSAELTEIQWTDVTDPSTPVSYFYESSNNSSTNPDGSFTSPVYQSGELSNSEIPANGTPEGIWYWHVRAKDFVGNLSAWTNAWQIIVDNTPSEDPEYPYGIITNPSANENVFGLIDLTAEYFDGDDENDDAVQWAVRAGTCEANTGTVAGNVDGFNDSFTWDGNLFSAPFNADLFAPGEYCFVFNPTDDGDVNVRETQLFNIAEDDEEVVYGCMDETAINFNSSATEQGEVVCEYDKDEENNNEQEEIIETSDDNSEEDEGRRSGRRRGGSVLGATTDGEVLGASTDSCAMYLNDYMQEGHGNASEITKLQSFLNEQGFVVPVSGIFGSETTEAVKQFQLKYKNDILMPWVNLGLSDGSPTGYVYKTTRWKINNIMCEGSETFPILP